MSPSTWHEQTLNVCVPTPPAGPHLRPCPAHCSPVNLCGLLNILAALSLAPSSHPGGPPFRIAQNRTPPHPCLGPAPTSFLRGLPAPPQPQGPCPHLALMPLYLALPTPIPPGGGGEGRGPRPCTICACHPLSSFLTACPLLLSQSYSNVSYKGRESLFSSLHLPVLRMSLSM